MPTLHKSLIGMIHIGAIPGSPFAAEPVEALVARAVAEAKTLADTGFDGLIIENMHDRPYVHGRKGPETVAVMTRVALAVRAAAPRLAFGVQVLSGGNHEALAIACATGGSPASARVRPGEHGGTARNFIRCENFVFSHIADEGLLERAEAGPLLRYRREIGAAAVAIYADLKKKHASHALTADVGLAEAAEAAAFFGADGVIVTGTATGKPTSVADVAEVRRAVAGLTRAGATGSVRVLVGSGVTPATVGPLMEHADALIVGSALKKGGSWDGPMDRAACQRMVRAVERVR